MRAEDDLTYQEYKENVEDAMRYIKNHGWTPRQVTDRMTDEDNELLIGTSEALWIISIGAYEVAMRWENTTTPRRKSGSFWKRISHLSDQRWNCGN